MDAGGLRRPVPRVRPIGRYPGRVPRNRLTLQQRKYATPQAAFRSGLEEKIAAQFRAAGITARFEEVKLSYVVPQSDHKYTPDFLLPNGVYVETKGLFTTDDRKKMKLIRAQYPDLDIRFVFSNANAKIAPKSKTTYAMWAETNGFKWAHKVVPQEWIDEVQGNGGRS